MRLIDDMNWDHATELLLGQAVITWCAGRLLSKLDCLTPIFLYLEEVDHCFAAKNGWKLFNLKESGALGGERAKSSGEIALLRAANSALQVESELLYFRKNMAYGVFVVMLF
jgi:hypothetical protein